MEQFGYITIDDGVKFINNGCLNFLNNSIKYTKSQNDNTNIFEISQHGINVFIEYVANDKLIESINTNVIELKKINRVNISEDDKIRLTFLIQFKFKFNLADEYIVRFENLFNEKKEYKISKKYIIKVNEKLNSGLKSIFKPVLNYNLKINNSCEFCIFYKDYKEHKGCKSKIIDENRVEKIAVLTFDDIEYLHENNISTIGQLKDNISFLKDETEGFKDRKSDVKKWISDDEDIVLYDKFYLKWSDHDKEVAYSVTFQGHAETDVVYAFAFSKMYSNDDIKGIVTLDQKPNSKEQVLNHYKAIVEEINNVINKEKKKQKDVIFYTLAPYERKNFEKIIETILEYQFYYEEDFRKIVLLTAEYFGMPYYCQNDFIKHINPFVDTWIDIKDMIEKYLYLAIDIKYSFLDVYNKLYKVRLNKSNSHDFSWALRPDYINQFWDKQIEKAQLEQQLLIKLSNADKLQRALLDLLKNRNKIIYPNKRIFVIIIAF